jgi:predicted dehydrogenase
MEDRKVWIVGAGQMAREYLKVLNSMGICPIVIGKSISNCQSIKADFKCEVSLHGLTNFLNNNPELPHKVIVAVGIEALKEITVDLLEYGIKEILLEKPGIAYPKEIFEILDKCNKRNIANILVAYNRRFYASVLKAEELIIIDEGVSSFSFEFTEWSHTIKKLNKTLAEWNNWFLGNSTHVIDTAFFLGGKPTQLSAYHQGGLDWHPASSVFAGAGVSEKGALFSYHADWEAPGRWVIEILTKKRRLLFKPMEALQVQVLGSVAINPVEIDDTLDKEFKPGLYLQTKAFLDGDNSRFCTIQEQAFMIEHYYAKMSGYE